MTDAHEALRQDVKQKAANEFVGLKRDRLFSISIFSIPITQGDLAVFDFNDAVIGESDAVGVTTEVIEDSSWRAERLFRIDDPVFLARWFDFASCPCDFPSYNFLLTGRYAMGPVETL